MDRRRTARAIHKDYFTHQITMYQALSKLYQAGLTKGIWDKQAIKILRLEVDWAR